MPVSPFLPRRPGFRQRWGHLRTHRRAADWSRREWALAAFIALLWAVALLAPAVRTPAMASMAFADDRHWHALANAMDVLSNLPFAGVGLWGLLRLRRLSGSLGAVSADTSASASAFARSNAIRCTAVFFVGLLLTAIASAYFHLQPDVWGLAIDRAGMTVAFAGLIGLAVCERVSQRSGGVSATVTLLGGLLAVVVCAASGNVLPWALLQFGGMALVLGLALLRPVPGAMSLRLGWVIAIYALAKCFEMADHAIYALSDQLLSGHTLKHCVAACVAWPVLQMLERLRPGAAAQS